MPVDDNYTKSLLHFNGIDASTTFVDESGKVWTATGNAEVDTALKVFGTGSGKFDGDVGSYISTPHHTDFDLGALDWTYDFRIRWANVEVPEYAAMVAQYDDDGNRFMIRLHESTNIYCYYLQDSVSRWVFGITWTPTVDTWYHIAVIRHGDTPLIFIDGVSQAVTENYPIAGKDVVALSGDITIGAENGGKLINASIDEFRFSKGIARWISNFTPPVREYIAFVPKTYWFF